jgi:protoporphyrinogen oxidase
VAIVGGGVAGLATCKALTCREIDCVLFEREARLGGLWVKTYPGACAQVLFRFLHVHALVLTVALVLLLIMPSCLLTRVLRMSLQGCEKKPVHHPVLKWSSLPSIM